MSRNPDEQSRGSNRPGFNNRSGPQGSRRVSIADENGNTGNSEKSLDLNIIVHQPIGVVEDSYSSSCDKIETISTDDIVSSQYRGLLSPDIKRVSIVTDNAFTHDFDSGREEYDSDSEDEKQEDRKSNDNLSKIVVIDLDGSDAESQMSNMSPPAVTGQDSLDPQPPKATTRKANYT